MSKHIEKVTLEQAKALPYKAITVPFKLPEEQDLLDSALRTLGSCNIILVEIKGYETPAVEIWRSANEVRE